MLAHITHTCVFSHGLRGFVKKNGLRIRCGDGMILLPAEPNPGARRLVHVCGKNPFLYNTQRSVNRSGGPPDTARFQAERFPCLFVRQV